MPCFCTAKYSIGDFPVAFRLCFKASPCAKPFIWKLVLFTCKSWFIYMWTKLIFIWEAWTRTRVETEARGNSEITLTTSRNFGKGMHHAHSEISYLWHYSCYVLTWHTSAELWFVCCYSLLIFSLNTTKPTLLVHACLCTIQKITILLPSLWQL